MSHTHIKKEQGEELKVEKDATVTKPFHPTDKLAARIHHHEKTNAVEILEGLKDGELPSNERIHKELEVAKHFAEHRQNIASTKEHEEMMRDIKNFVDVSQKTLDEKNRDDLLQRFVADIGALIEKPTLMSDNVSPKEMKSDVKELLKSLRVVLMSLIKSNNFRNACIDLVKIIRELFNYHTKQTQPTGRLTEAFVATDRHTKDEAKNIATDVKSTAQNMTIKDIPQKHRDRIMGNIKKLIRELNEHPDSREAFGRLLNIWGSISTELYAHWDSNANDPEFNRVYLEAIALVESYTGGRSLKEFLTRFRKAMTIIENDKEITAFFKDFREYLSTAINKPELIDNQAFVDKGYALIKQGRAHARRYREDLVINSCIDEAAELAYLIRRDARMHQLKKQAAKVASDFVYTDKKGRKHFNSDILPVIRQEIIPFLVSRIKEVPVPGFQMEGPDFEYLIVDDLFITIDDIFPDMVKVHLYNDTALGLGGDHTPGLHHKSYLKLMIEGVRPKVKDFFFSFKRKKVITIADEGRADLRITGTGINIYIKFELKTDPDDKYRTILGVAETDVMVDNVDLDILEARHRTLLNFVTSLFKGRIRTQTENAIKAKIAEYAADLATVLNKKVISGATMATLGQPGAKLVTP